MIDIDMENTHPRLLAHYCKQNNTETPMLNDYIENREEMLKSLMETFQFTRDQAKKNCWQSSMKDRERRDSTPCF